MHHFAPFCTIAPLLVCTVFPIPFLQATCCENSSGGQTCFLSPRGAFEPCDWPAEREIVYFFPCYFSSLHSLRKKWTMQKEKSCGRFKSRKLFWFALAFFSWAAPYFLSSLEVWQILNLKNGNGIPYHFPCNRVKKKFFSYAMSKWMLHYPKILQVSMIYCIIVLLHPKILNH